MGWLQQWALESPEICLQHSSSPNKSLRLHDGLVEVYYLAGQRKETAEEAELASGSATSCSNSFELHKAVYFLTNVQYELSNQSKATEIVNSWASQITADTKKATVCVDLSRQNRDIERIKRKQ